MRPTTLDDFTGPFKRTTQINFRDCPVCERGTWKVYIAPDTGLWNCRACNAAGKLDMGLANAMAVLFAQRATEAPEWRPVELPGWGQLSIMAQNFLLEKYGIGVEESHRYSLVEGTEAAYRGRILIPYFDKAGDIIYYNGRIYGKLYETGRYSIPKYKAADGRHPLFVPRNANQMWVPRQGWRYPHIVLVEGPFDAIKVTEAGFLCAALGGTNLPKYLLPDLIKLAGDAPVVVCLDSDALAQSIGLVRRLQPFLSGEVRNVVLPPGQDPGSMSLSTIREVLA